MSLFCHPCTLRHLYSKSIWVTCCRVTEKVSLCKPPKSDGSCFLYQVIPQVCLHKTVHWLKVPEEEN